MTESHVHILSNMFEVQVVIFQARGGFVEASLIAPGFSPTKLVPRQQLKDVIAAKPTVCLHLNNPPSHFEAVMPSALAPPRSAANEHVSISLVE